jgi:mediator of RNA polymerase II transcription subunit 14
VESLAVGSGVGGRPEEDPELETMPGVIMEDRSRNGAHTNHDRDPMPNGTNGTTPTPETVFDKSKFRGEPQPGLKQSQFTNGTNGTMQESQTQSQSQSQSETLVVEPLPTDMAERLKQLPPELFHITEGFEPLSRLLSRLAQVTHNRLSAKIMELASMPIPSSAVNGNGTHYSNGTDDNSADNVRKKVNLLKFAEATHADWTKALVITHWSRVSKDVSKLIDMKVHIENQKALYNAAFFELMEVKRGLINARVPNPDLRTAVEVLSTGKASWMPNVSS